MKSEVEAVQTAAQGWSPEVVLCWAFDRFGNDVAISSAFGPEGMVLIDMAAHIQRKFRLFTIDTGFLFPETHKLMAEVQERYGIAIEKVAPTLSPEQQGKFYGERLWARDPDQCCALRKVEPLRQKMGQLRAWITSIRRDQTAARAHAQKVEWDAKFEAVKINPLVDWSADEVWQYIRRHDVPYNELHDRNYPSVGCTHCTRAIKPGEEARAGRWAGFAKTECGLHITDAGTQVGVEH